MIFTFVKITVSFHSKFLPSSEAVHKDIPGGELNVFLEESVSINHQGFKILMRRN